MSNPNKLATLYLMLLAFAVVCFLCGCERTETFETTSGYVMPKGLEDCQAYYLKSERQQNVTVIRCPNSQTATTYTVPQGKSRRTISNVVIDGQEYELKKKE